MKERRNQKNRKGQSAIEYLTTYGWMLLVIAIVGGSIFTTVMGSTGIQSVSGLTNADVQVSDYGLNDNGLQLSLRSATADQVEIQKVTVTDPRTGISADISISETVPVGDTATVNLQDVQTTDTSDTYDLDITYNTGSLNGLVAEGKITGSFGVFNRINLEKAKFNRSTNKLQIDVKNTGDNQTDSISYTVEANNTDYTGSLSNLDAGEEAQITVSTDKTYSLQSVNLNTEGTQFIDSNSGLKCTPTKGLVGYWTFNREQTQNGWAVDLSGYGNNGSFGGEVNTGSTGIVGGSYSFIRSNNDYVTVDNPTNISGSFTAVSWTSLNDDGVNNGVLGTRSPNDRSFDFKLKSNDLIHGDIGNGTDWLTTNADANYDFKTEKWGMVTYDVNRTSYTIFWNSDKLKTGFFDKNEPLFSDNYHDIHIGYTGSASEEMGGRIDETRIYNRSLSQSEIQRLYQVRSEDWAVDGCRLTG